MTQATATNLNRIKFCIILCDPSTSDIHAMLLLALHIKLANFSMNSCWLTTDTDVRRPPLFIRFSLLTQPGLNIWLKERTISLFSDFILWFDWATSAGFRNAKNLAPGLAFCSMTTTPKALAKEVSSPSKQFNKNLNCDYESHQLTGHTKLVLFMNSSTQYLKPNE